MRLEFNQDNKWRFTSGDRIKSAYFIERVVEHRAAYRQIRLPFAEHLDEMPSVGASLDFQGPAWLDGPLAQNPPSSSIRLPSLKRLSLNARGSTMGASLTRMSAVSSPAPGPIPKPCPE